ncbi:TetR/AcrR family transcriptional regulator [Marinobacter fonticola]|uniref:TetR/AcrR family transcriptional regulator n=1 Tax=Marinobacter fonticola TaxID=2603215 RepID=UPI0011E85439|nr:TetR/AcrR family transcriptional regulator [Marinobacter fonticola]
MRGATPGPAARKVVKQGKRELNRINNRRAILHAARECFRERGYEQTTIRDIIRRTDLAAGTFYNYFSDKRDIFIALLQSFLGNLRTLIKAGHRNARDELDLIRSTYLALFRATAEDPIIYELAYRNDQAIRELLGADLLGLAMASLEEDLRRAVANGLIDIDDQDYLSATCRGIAYEMSLQLAHRVADAPERAEEEAERAADFAVNMLRYSFSADSRQWRSQV